MIEGEMRHGNQHQKDFSRSPSGWRRLSSHLVQRPSFRTVISMMGRESSFGQVNDARARPICIAQANTKQSPSRQITDRSGELRPRNSSENITFFLFKMHDRQLKKYINYFITIIMAHKEIR